MHDALTPPPIGALVRYVGPIAELPWSRRATQAGLVQAHLPSGLVKVSDPAGLLGWYTAAPGDLRRVDPAELRVISRGRPS